MLTPRDPIYCKRATIGTDFYETFNRDNVTARDAKTHDIELTANGIQLGDEDIPLDTVVLATGFDAITGALLKMDIRGRDGLPLREKWQDNFNSYLGLGIPGFPNLFTITGPNSPALFSNVVAATEQHVEWISDCIQHMESNEHALIEADEQAAQIWAQQTHALSEHSVLSACDSYYQGSNIPGKPRGINVYVDYPGYVDKCDQVADAGYEGFKLTRRT